MGSLHVLDAADPVNMREVAQRRLGSGAQSMLLVDGLLYVGLGGGLRVFDVADPAQPREVASYGQIGSVNAGCHLQSPPARALPW